MASMEKQIDDIWKIFHGEDGKTGLVVAVDRNTQHRKSNRWWMRLLVAAVVGSVVTSAFALIQ